MAEKSVCFFRKTLFLMVLLCHSVADAAVKHTGPKFTVEPSDLFAVEGREAKLACRAVGEPAPRFVAHFIAFKFVAFSSLLPPVHSFLLLFLIQLIIHLDSYDHPDSHDHCL